jgi:hypothetical protein
MAKRDGLKRWIEAERTRSRLQTLGFAAIYARARYLGMPGEMLVEVSPSRQAPRSTQAGVEQFLQQLQSKWAKKGGVTT